MLKRVFKIVKCNMKEYLLVRGIVKKIDGLYRWWKRKCGGYVYHLGL